MGYRDEGDLAEFLLGNVEVADRIRAAAREAAAWAHPQLSQTAAKRLEKRRQTEDKGQTIDEASTTSFRHYGMWSHFVQARVVYFADLIAWVHESRTVGRARTRASQRLEEECRANPALEEAASEDYAVPLTREFLVRRYVASLIAANGMNWPNSTIVALAFACVLRKYPSTEINLSFITRDVLMGPAVSKYKSNLLSKIRDHITDRFEHVTGGPDDFGRSQFGWEIEAGSHDEETVRETLRRLSPFGVACFVDDTPLTTVGFTTRFASYVKTTELGPKEQATVPHYDPSRPDRYVDEDGRRAILRAHALTCPACFESIAVEYEHLFLNKRSGRSTTPRKFATIYRLPRLYAGAEVQKEPAE